MKIRQRGARSFAKARPDVCAKTNAKYRRLKFAERTVPETPFLVYLQGPVRWPRG